MPTGSRREFLSMGLGLLATRVFGDALTQPTPVRPTYVTSMDGRFEPISTAVVEPWNEGRLRKLSFTVKVGATKPFRAVHCSDTHVSLSDIEEMYAKKANYVAGVRRYARFPQAIPSFYSTLDFVAAEPDTLFLHTGDLIDFGTRACYDFVRHNLKGIDLVYAIGNHEYELPDSSYAADKEGQQRQLKTLAGLHADLNFSSRVVNGVDFVAIDNARYGEGVVSAQVRAAVEREFQQGLPVVMMCHTPPYQSRAFNEARLQGYVDLSLQRNLKDDIPVYLKRDCSAAWQGDAETAAFWRRIVEKDNFKAVLCGHRHWAWNEPLGKGHLYLAGGNYEGCLNEFRFV